MNPRASELIQALHLQPHPEGGWYAEVFRSAQPVQPQDGRPQRSALTSIYFLLQAHQRSQWHRVRSDEVWVHLEGDPLKLGCWASGSPQPVFSVLGPVGAHDGQRPQHTVAAGHWQAARPLAPTGGPAQGYTLVACMVAPGFDFADFCLLDAQLPEFEVLSKIDL